MAEKKDRPTKAESAKVDYKKLQKELYQPGKKPALVQVPEMAFIMVDGTGDPNGPAYQNAISALYALSFTIKMSKMGAAKLDGYFEYSMMPLEGLWWVPGAADEAEGKGPFLEGGDRDSWHWTSMIRQPEFVTPDIFAWAMNAARAKKPETDFSGARFARWEEGLCVQAMHIGPFAAEPATLALMEAFTAESGCLPDHTATRRHHELYMGDPRKVAPEKMKTVLRIPVQKIDG